MLLVDFLDFDLDPDVLVRFFLSIKIGCGSINNYRLEDIFSVRMLIKQK